MKQFVRKRTDQTYHTMLKLIQESRTNFQQKEVQLKLFRRFWHCLEAYNQGKTYSEVLQLFFSSNCSGKIKTHRKITNNALDN